MTAFLVPFDAPGRRGPADPADERRRQLQRGVPHRRPAAGRPCGSAASARAGASRSPASASNGTTPSGGGGGHTGGGSEQVLAAAQHFDRTDDPIVRQALADLYIQHTRRPVHQPACQRRAPRRADAGTRGVARQADVDARTCPRRQRRDLTACSARGSWPTPASGAPTPGPSTCSARRATRSPAAPTRSSATSSASACSACPAEPACRQGRPRSASAARRRRALNAAQRGFGTTLARPTAVSSRIRFEDGGSDVVRRQHRHRRARSGCSHAAGRVPSPVCLFVMSVSTTPGSTALTRIPSAASPAQLSVIRTTPAFVAE